MDNLTTHSFIARSQGHYLKQQKTSLNTTLLFKMRHWVIIGIKINVRCILLLIYYMDIENEFCRMKSICEMESFAANNPIAKLAINTVK